MVNDDNHVTACMSMIKNVAKGLDGEFELG